VTSVPARRVRARSGRRMALSRRRQSVKLSV
jgi:hypothetical protein